MNVLFVNHKQQQCGVYQFGKRVFDLSNKNARVSYTYIEVENQVEFNAWANHSYDAIIYNWYPVTMPWLSEDYINNRKDTKHLFIFHDGNIRHHFDGYLFSGAEGKDINFPKEKTYILPRPLFKYSGEYRTNQYPTIGSFGFGGWQKGFTDLVEKVNREYDNANINIQMPFAFFGDRHGKETMRVAARCKELNIKPGINLNIDHKFLTNEQTLEFLASNDINIFLYHSVNQGLSSVIDYALSVKRPIGITNDSMFKHVYKPEIDAEANSIASLISAETQPLEEYYTKWNPDNFYLEMERVLYETVK